MFHPSNTLMIFEQIQYYTKYILDENISFDLNSEEDFQLDLHNVQETLQNANYSPQIANNSYEQENNTTFDRKNSAQCQNLILLNNSSQEISENQRSTQQVTEKNKIQRDQNCQTQNLNNSAFIKQITYSENQEDLKNFQDTSQSLGQNEQMSSLDQISNSEIEDQNQAKEIRSPNQSDAVSDTKETAASENVQSSSSKKLSTKNQSKQHSSESRSKPNNNETKIKPAPSPIKNLIRKIGQNFKNHLIKLNSNTKIMKSFKKQQQYQFTSFTQWIQKKSLSNKARIYEALTTNKYEKNEEIFFQKILRKSFKESFLQIAEYQIKEENFEYIKDQKYRSFLENVAKSQKDFKHLEQKWN